MRKLIFRNGYSPGDVVMLTAAVRDLHRAYPGQFLTDVRTVCPDLWEHNPYITQLFEKDPEVELLDCSYPLIDRCNEAPYHCLHGFIEFLNERLGLSIKPTEFRGDIHLSAQEKAWYSQVKEVTGRDIPFWIVAAGGKYDVTIKWWATERYQAVVDHFRGRIQFVQVGQCGHHHPRLDGVIDLRGQTTLRELVRLVYHAHGVLCPVTALMHLAAAVEVRGRGRIPRPCVVVAGAREPAHWEAYPGHQFIHNNGALPCGGRGGCWKDRAVPLGDGDSRDRSGCRCVDVVNGLPRCMDFITPAEVIRRIELYFRGRPLGYLTSGERRAAVRGVAATRANPFDNQPLSLHSARLACDQFVRDLPAYPGGGAGRGIVICGGGTRYFTNAWVCINILRQLGCRLPIQLWHLGPRELDRGMRELVAPLGVECMDASQVRRRHPVRRLGGWELKPYALLYSPFAEVLLLDADNVPVQNPEFLFDVPEYRSTGAVFWPDYGRSPKAQPIWRSSGVRRPAEPEFETGQILLDKRRVWSALRLAMWFNEHSDFYYHHFRGDKETFHLAFRKLRQTYSLVPHRIRTLSGTMCQHDFTGARLFQHRNTDKWNLFLRNKHVPGFRLEPDCRRHITRLQRLWDGRMSLVRPPRPDRNHLGRRDTRLVACMISCPERDALRQRTLRDLACSDWDSEPRVIMLDGAAPDCDRRQHQAQTAWLALSLSLDHRFDYLLFLEDDLVFNRHLRHNLLRWFPLRAGHITLAGLYNPGLREWACDVPHNAIVIEPRAVFGSQAFLLARPTVRFLVEHWNRVAGMQDIKMSRLAGRLKQPIFYHVPSLVQHVGRESLWGGRFHQAKDFDRSWRA